MHLTVVANFTFSLLNFRALHDVKATSIGGEYVRFKAEVDFDGREVARCYLEKHDLEIMFKVCRITSSISK